MKHSKQILCLATIIGIGVFSTFSFVQNNTQFYSGIKATNEAYTLEHGAISGLENTYKNGTFTTKTRLNNNISWEYKYGKSSSGLIELGKDSIGNPSDNNYCIGNTSAITSITDMTVLFSGADYLYLYGSSDAENYYLVDTLTSSHYSTTNIAKYLYFRIVNGNQMDTAATITSISFSYACEISDYSDEMIDISSKTILADANSVLSYDNKNIVEGFNSSKSLKITGSTSNNTFTWVISLGRTYTGLQFKKATLTYYVESVNNSNYDNSHNYTRFMIYPAKNTSRLSGSPYFQTGNLKNGTAWGKQTVSFANLTSISDEAEINALYIKSVYVTDYIHIDQMHISLGMEELSPSLINQYEANDQISENIHVGYGTVTSTFDYIHHSVNSVRSSRINIDSDWRMWYYNDTGMGDDMSGYTLSFDILYADFIEGKSAAAATYKFAYNSARWTVSLNEESAGVIRTVLENGWTHIVINFDDVQAEQGTSTDTSDLNNLGFNVGYARTIYVDNLHMDHQDTPTEPTILLNSPVNGSIEPILPEQVRTYCADIHVSRAAVENDYILDVDEVNTTEGHPRVTNYYDSSKHYDYFAPIKLKYRIYNYSTDGVKVHLARSSDFSDETVYNNTSLQLFSLKNLLRNTKYYWKIVTNDGLLESDVYTFTTEDTARFISAGNVYNVRDFGGYLTKNGKRIKQGLVFRGQEIVTEDYGGSDKHYANLTEEVSNLFLNELGIKKDVDLRTPGDETNNITESPLGNTVEFCPMPDYCSAYEHAPKHPDKLETVFKAFLEVDTKPVYFHCRGGADRTGTIGFILGGFLGMSFTDLLLEYEYTSFSKNYRPRDDNPYSYTTFPEFINTLYDNTYGYDQSGNHDIQEICTNLMLAAGLTQSELNAISTKLLED